MEQLKLQIKVAQKTQTQRIYHFIIFGNVGSSRIFNVTRKAWNAVRKYKHVHKEELQNVKIEFAGFKSNPQRGKLTVTKFNS